MLASRLMSASPRELDRDNDDEHSDVVSEQFSVTAEPIAGTADLSDDIDPDDPDAAATDAATDGTDAAGTGGDDVVSLNVNCTSDTPRPPTCVSTEMVPAHGL